VRATVAIESYAVTIACYHCNYGIYELHVNSCYGFALGFVVFI